MVNLFPIIETTDTIFRNGLQDLNECRNLVSLENSIHSMFNRGALTLTLLTTSG